MKFGVVLLTQHSSETYQERFLALLEQVRIIRKLQFDSVWIPEMHFVEGVYYPAIATLGSVSSYCEGLVLGSCVLLLPLYNPFFIAETFAMLDIMTGGRVVLGVGLGDGIRDYEAYGVEFTQRSTRLEESIQLIRSLWKGERVTHRGSHYSLTDVSLSIRPVQRPNPPIWIGGGHSEKALKRVAELGDAWIPGPFTPLRILKTDFAKYEKYLTEVGRTIETIERPLRRELYVARNRDRARERARFFLEKRLQDHIEWWQKSKSGRAFAERVQDVDLLDDACIVGTPDDCIERIETYRRDLGVNHMLLRMQFPSMSEQESLEVLELFGKAVLPYFANDRDI
jgi:alkanesulfonate monooxygenase SsuD/methylene tetrahydromethanopterin reductase-like flavin-dependent oxidoreductase (luciferase family)